MLELLVQILVWAALAYVVIGAVVMVVGFVTAMFSSESRPPWPQRRQLERQRGALDRPWPTVIPNYLINRLRPLP